MPKCDFNKVASHIFRTPFLKTPLDGCFCYVKLLTFTFLKYFDFTFLTKIYAVNSVRFIFAPIYIGGSGGGCGGEGDVYPAFFQKFEKSA